MAMHLLRETIWSIDNGSSRKEAVMFKTIIWATDGSETADGALPFAKALADCDGGKLVVVHNNELLVGRAYGYPLFADEEDLEAKIREQVDELKAEGVDVSLELVSGVATPAAHMISETARKVGADVIVVGTRGHGPIASVLVGGVTQRLLHIAPCPVLAVPTAKQRGLTDRKREHAATAR